MRFPLAQIMCVAPHRTACFRAAGRRKVTPSFNDLPTCGAVAVAAPLLLHATLEAMTHARIIRRETLRHFKWLRGVQPSREEAVFGGLGSVTSTRVRLSSEIQPTVENRRR